MGKTLFKNKKLINISFGEFVTILSFDDNISITIESEYNLYIKNRKKLINPSIPDSGQELLSLLGSNCLLCSLSTEKNLKLEFSNEVYIELYNKDEVFENFQVIIDNNYLVE